MDVFVRPLLCSQGVNYSLSKVEHINQHSGLDSSSPQSINGKKLKYSGLWLAGFDRSGAEWVMGFKSDAMVGTVDFTLSEMGVIRGFWAEGCPGMSYIPEGFLQRLVTPASWAGSSVSRLLMWPRCEMMGFGSERQQWRWSDSRYIQKGEHIEIWWLDEESRMTPEFFIWGPGRTKRSFTDRETQVQI